MDQDRVRRLTIDLQGLKRREQILRMKLAEVEQLLGQIIYERMLTEAQLTAIEHGRPINYDELADRFNDDDFVDYSRH